MDKIKKFIADLKTSGLYLASFLITKPYRFILDEKETIRMLREGYSLARYGDGELGLIRGYDYWFQDSTPELRRELIEGLKVPVSRLLIGLPPFYPDRIDYSVCRIQTWRRLKQYLHLYLNVFMWHQYASSFVTRPSGIRNLCSKEYFESLRLIWERKRVILVSSSSTMSSHFLFSNALKVEQLDCLPTDAWQEIDQIESDIVQSVTKDTIVLISCGPTATVLVRRLARRGIQSIDIGSVTKEYDWWKNKNHPIINFVTLHKVNK